MPKPALLRRRKLIKPRLQLGLIGSFAGMAVMAMLLQFLVLGHYMVEAAVDVQTGGGQLVDRVPSMLVATLGISVVILLPIFTLVGLFLTHRFAGPIHRFEEYLHAVAQGQQTGPCRIRKGDQLQSLCDAINRAMESRNCAAPADAASEAPVEPVEEPVSTS